MRVRNLIITFFALLTGLSALITFAALGPWKKEEVRKFGCFSWSQQAMEKEEWPVMLNCFEQTGVSSVYQEFSMEQLSSDGKEAAEFVDKMSRRGVKVYALMGEAEWAYDKKGETVIENLETIVKYNKKRSEDRQIHGVMVDVEPYLLEEWMQGQEARTKLMTDYVSNMEHAYIYAMQNQLEFWVCIPTFYDVTNKDILEELICYACDGVAVMNYNRTDEYGQMAMEAGFAREYEKGILCVYELQEPGNHKLEEINTYAGEGLEALWDSAKRLEKQFGYEKLGFAYHYYEPLKKMTGSE